MSWFFQKNYYLENGYILFKNVIPELKIDRLIQEFENFKNKGRSIIHNHTITGDHVQKILINLGF